MIDLTKESELVKKAQSGDSEALSRLWDNLTPKLFGYLVNTLKDKTLAEDILQNTWVKAINALSNFEDNNFSAWMFAIARNELRQHWRKKQPDSVDEFKDEPSADDREKIDSKLTVEKVLSKLTEEEAEIIRLKYIADLSVKDIARILNINQVAARVRIHRILKKAENLIKQ